MDLNKNITWVLDDSTSDELYLNNEELIGQMMNEFNSINNNDFINNKDSINNNDFINNNDSINDLTYFIQKELYCGDNDLYYNEEYKLKDLMKICEYYGIAKNVKASKCKKQDIISTIIYFENSPENYDIVLKRNKMWAYMTELLEDPKMKRFLLW